MNRVPALTHELEDPAKAVVAGRNLQYGSRVKAVGSDPRDQGEEALLVFPVEGDVKEDVPTGSGLSPQKLLLFSCSPNHSVPANRLSRARSRPLGQDLINGALNFEPLAQRKAVLIRCLGKRGKRRGDDR